MGANTASAIIKINLQIEGGQNVAVSVGNLKELKAAIKQINESRITVDPRSPQFQTASNQLKTLQGLYKGLEKDADSAEIQIRQANAALNEPTKAIGYYRQLQAQLVVLKNQFKDLSEEEAKGKIGQGIAKRANALSAELKANDALFGDFQRNVGNYRQAITGIGDALAPGLIAGGGIVLGVSLIKDAMAAGLNQSISYEKGLSRLSALSGLEGPALENLNKIATSLQVIEVNGQKIVNTGPNILEGLTLVGNARPELLQDAAALGEVTKAAIVLSKASGDDLETSVSSVTETMAQFGLEGKDAVQIINELASGSRQGKIEIPALRDEIERLGPTAKNSNVTLAETIALFENMGEKGLKGERAAVQLRNVLINLSSAEVLPRSAQRVFQQFGIDAKILSDNTLPIKRRLEELNPIIGNTSALVQIFGKENIDAAAILSSSVPRYEEMRVAVEGTNEAFRQAGINADNAATKYENLKNNALNSLREEFEGSASSGGALLDVLNSLITDFDLVGIATRLVTGPFGDVANEFNKLKNALGFDGSGGKDEFQKASESVDALTKKVEQLKSSLGSNPKNGVLAATQELAKAQQQLEEAQARKQRFGAIRASLQGGQADPSLTDQPFSLADPLFPDFKTNSIESTNALSKGLEKVAGSTDKAAKSTKAKRVEDLGAADSVARLTKEVQRLQDVLFKGSQADTGINTLNLVRAEQALARAKAKEAEARNPTPNLTEVQQAEAGLILLGVDINNSENAKDAENQLRDLASDLAESVGVTIPVSIDQDENRRYFENQKFFLEQENKLKEQNDAKERKRIEERKKLQEDFFEVGITSVENFNTQMSQQEIARVDSQLQKSKDAIQEEFDAKRLAAQGNAQIIANLDKQQKAKQAEAEKKAARERKAIAIKEASIAYALELIKSGGNPIKIASASAAFLLGLLAIKAQEFHHGGVVKGIEREEGVVKVSNMKPTRRGDNRVAFLKVGERVLTKENQAAIEQQYGSEIWRSVGAKDPGSIFGNTHRGLSVPVFGSGRPILNVTTSFSRQDIAQLSKAVAQTNHRMSKTVKDAMIEAAKYSAREQKALSKTR